MPFARSHLSRKRARAFAARAGKYARTRANACILLVYTSLRTPRARAHAQAYWVQRLERAVAQGKDASGFITEQKELRKVRLASALHVQTVLRITCFFIVGKNFRKSDFTKCTISPLILRIGR